MDPSGIPGAADVESQSSEKHSFCSYAATGSVVAFQPIFICRSCFNELSDETDINTPLCICQACADCCHPDDEHDVEYIGVGPCYCDCSQNGKCSIVEKSLQEADRLGIKFEEHSIVHEREGKEPAESAPIQDVYTIPLLKNADLSACLVEEVQELVKHSKETFWIDESHHSSLCALELLAWAIYQRHIQNYASLLGDSNSICGAEWWVQVKSNDSNDGVGSAIDLHYDKDEALAESFGLGAFPLLSTVTYLTASTQASPTVVLDHTYTQGEDNLIDTMLVSQPQLGKHLVFDGTLLHGAPSHPDLRSKPPANQTDLNKAQDSVRVTFLVNIWRGQRPANVIPLDPVIREKLVQLELNKQYPSALVQPLELVQGKIKHVVLQSEEDLPEDLRHRIELPFVTKGVTWEDQLNLGGENDPGGSEEEEASGGLVVVIFPPPPFTESTDTVKVQFKGGLQGYLDYPHAATKQEKMAESDYESGYV